VIVTVFLIAQYQIGDDFGKATIELNEEFPEATYLILFWTNP
jgi:hypothetical protein